MNSNLNQSMKTHGKSLMFKAKKAGAASLAGSVILGMLAFAGMSPATAATQPPTVPLGTAIDYSVLAGSTVTNTGPSTLSQNLGLTPGSAVTGFPPGLVSGVVNVSNGPALQAQTDATAAFNSAASRTPTAMVAADLTGLTLPGGVYSTAMGSMALNGTLTLDGANDPNSVFIFQSASTLTTGPGSKILLINGASPCNVFFQTGSSATLGTNSSFVGTILAQTSVTANTGAAINGRALALTGAVTLDTNAFTGSTCAAAVPPVVVPPVVVPPVVVPPVATPPVVVPPVVTPPAAVPAIVVAAPDSSVTGNGTGNSAGNGTEMTPGTTVTTPTDSTSGWTPANSTTPLADTGVNTTPLFLGAGILLLLVGFGLFFSGRFRNLRKQ